MRKKHLAVFGCLSIFTIVFSAFAGLTGAFVGSKLADNGIQGYFQQDVQVINEESAITQVAEKSNSSVVSIVITQNVPVYEQYRSSPFFEDFGDRQQIGTEEQEVGSGTGFIVSNDGLIITNRHVVEEDDVSYTVFLSDGTTKPATVLARDTLLDIAFIDIEGDSYTPLPLGTSEGLKVGQRVVAIGNALGEFGNTVSTGIVSGLSRNIIASDQNGGATERLSGVIQTDASINFGNSGGPLMDISGNVIGVNVAVAQDAENIGFAIPIDLVKDVLESVQTTGKIERPVLGVRYIPINEDVQERNDLSVDYGALVSRSADDEPGVLPGSPADKAGILENDIILEVEGVRVNDEHRLEEIIQNYKLGSVVQIKLLSKGNEKVVTVTLDKVAQ